MAKYIVRIREVHISYREVEADSVEEAIAEAGGATETMLEYSHTLDTDHWDVEDEHGNIVRRHIPNRPDPAIPF